MTNHSDKRLLGTGLRAIAAAFVILLAACSKVSPENYQKIEAGMARSEVYAILGQPDEVSGDGVGHLTMSAERWAGRTQVISVTFGGDRVLLKSIDER